MDIETHQFVLLYRVGSENLSRRKIGHAHDNFADSEHVAGECEPNVHAPFNFLFRKRSGKSDLFLSMTKIQLKRVNHNPSRRTIDAPSTVRFHKASSGSEKRLVQHGLVEKRQTSWKIESFCLESTNLKKPNTTDLERDRQRPRLGRSAIDRRRRTWTPSAGQSSWVFFFFFLRSSNNFRFAFRAFKVASQAFTWNISICSRKINHVLRCLLRRELITGRARLRTADRGAASQLQLTELKEQLVAQRGLRAQARKLELKSLPGPAVLLDMPEFMCFLHPTSLQTAMSFLPRCRPGWIGEDCSTPCPDDLYGNDCNSTCLCQNRAACSHVNGSCQCVPGFKGTICNESELPVFFLPPSTFSLVFFEGEKGWGMGWAQFLLIKTVFSWYCYVKTPLFLPCSSLSLSLSPSLDIFRNTWC